MNDSRTDEALMNAYADDEDEAAFAELVRRYQGMLTTVVRRRVKHPEDARDLVQQAFLQAHRARHRYQHGRPLRPWLYTIAANLSRDFARLRRHHVEVYLEHDAPAPQTRDPLVVLGERRLVRRAMAELPPKQRAVMAMHWFEGMTYREIAEQVGATPTAVKLHGYRGKKALQAQLLQQNTSNHQPIEPTEGDPTKPSEGGQDLSGQDLSEGGQDLSEGGQDLSEGGRDLSAAA